MTNGRARDQSRGWVRGEFADVATQLRREVRRDRVGGIAVCVYHDGEKVVDIWGGDRNARGDLWENDTLALCWSTVKGVTATALNILVDRGLIEYDAKVADYWPEFAANGKGEISVGQLVSHTGGMFNLRDLVTAPDQMLDWDSMTAALAAAPAAYPPGERTDYHAITFGWLAGELVRRVTHTPLADFVTSQIAEPLGIDELHVALPKEARPRVAQMTRKPRWVDSPRLTERGLASEQFAPLVKAFLVEGIFEFFWSDAVYDAPIPGANGVFTARSLARMYAALAAGGTLDGVRIMRPETVRAMSRVQRTRSPRLDATPAAFRMGYHGVSTTAGMHESAFGHFGYGGAGAWADPDRKLSVGITLNRIVGGPTMYNRLFRLGGAAVRCADRTPS